MGADPLKDRKPLEKACANTSGIREQIMFQQLSVREINRFKSFYCLKTPTFGGFGKKTDEAFKKVKGRNERLNGQTGRKTIRERDAEECCYGGAGKGH